MRDRSGTFFTRFCMGLAFILLFSMGTIFAQADEEEDLERRKSPLSIAKINHNDTYLKITYSRPTKKGRKIFGDLVPYDKIWRTGANEATEITITQPIQFAGKKVEPGTYSIFTIPAEQKWTVVLNEEKGQWGAYKYNKKKDYLRVQVPSKKLDETVEAFTIEFSKPENNSTILSMMWDQTKIDIPIQFPGGS